MKRFQVFKRVRTAIGVTSFRRMESFAAIGFIDTFKSK